MTRTSESPSLRRAVSLLALVSAALTAGACGSNADSQPCPYSCPAAHIGVDVSVTTATSTPADGVQATLSGPVTATMICQPNGSATLCEWPATVPVTAGTYSLQVSAPGYPSTTVAAVVTVAPPECGCISAVIQPSAVSLGASG